MNRVVVRRFFELGFRRRIVVFFRDGCRVVERSLGLVVRGFDGVLFCCLLVVLF